MSTLSPTTDVSGNCVRSPLHVCIVQPVGGAVSETFLKAQADFLPARVTVVHGTPAQVDGREFPADSIVARGCRKLQRLIRGGPWISPQEASLRKAVRHVRPDVVLAQYGDTGALLWRTCRDEKIPLVVHFHGYDASHDDTLAEYGAAYRLMFQEAQAIVAVSRTMERALIALGAPEEKIHYSPCGVDCSQFVATQPENAKPVFLAVGRFTEKKAPYLTLMAFAKLCDVCPTARLRMIGGGRLLEMCHDLAKALKISDRVTFLGPQPHARVADEMRAARCFVQHSIVAAHGDSEGTPVSILEAGACGLPVIATRHAGIPEVVLENETGLLVDEGDIDAMANHMIRIAEDPQLAGTLGRNAREHIVQNFSMEHNIERLNAILVAAAASRRAVM